MGLLIYNGGTLTDAQAKQLDDEENVLSLKIFYAAHNNSLAGEIPDRDQNQDARIARDVNNGSTAPAVAAVLAAQEEVIEAQRQADLTTGNGTLTATQFKQLNDEQNVLSARIFSLAHNHMAN